jgi:hypothetical protein
MPYDITTLYGKDVSGNRSRVIGVVTGPALYVAGGEPITPAMIKMGRLEAILFQPAIDAGRTTMYHLMYDAVNGTVVWWDCGTGNEAIAGANLSAFTARFEAIGK